MLAYTNEMKISYLKLFFVRYLSSVNGFFFASTVCCKIPKKRSCDFNCAMRRVPCSNVLLKSSFYFLVTCLDFLFHIVAYGSFLYKGGGGGKRVVAALTQ